MTDRYEQFRKWLTKKVCNSALNFEEEVDVSSAIELLIEFENEQFEKGKEKEIKQIICDEVWKSTGILIENRRVDNIYKKLKEKDLIR